MHFGYSHVLTHAVQRTKCWCHTTRFDVDRFGRIVYPNTFQFEFVAIDNSRNLIFRIKNKDVPQVAIGLAHHIEVTDRAVYAADHFNNQVVVFALTPDEEAIVALPSLGAETGQGVLSSKAVLFSYPNPINSRTAIMYRVSSRQVGSVELKIYDINNRLVRTLADERKKPGGYTVSWEGKNNSGQPVSAGIYYCRLKYGTLAKTLKLAVIR
jgi:hypothetical protein